MIQLCCDYCGDVIKDTASYVQLQTVPQNSDITASGFKAFDKQVCVTGWLTDNWTGAGA